MPKRAISFSVYISVVLIFLFHSPPLHAHSQTLLIPELTERGLPKRYIESVFNHPDFNRFRNPRLASCTGVRRGTPDYESVVRRGKINRAVDYYEKHKTAFEGVRNKVPAEYILAIIGTETNFGIYLGSCYVMRQLYSIYTQNRARKKRDFALEQIAALLRVAQDQKWSTEKLLSLRGSSAGAFGLGHFIPTSFRFAVDGNKDGVINLEDPADAIPSIANYLVRHGWDTNSPQKAIFRYNPDRKYVRKILDLADKIRDSIKKSPRAS